MLDLDISMQGDSLESALNRSQFIVNDLLPGKLVNLASSFTCEATTLGEEK